MKKLNLKFGMINPYRLMSVFVLAGLVLLTFTRCAEDGEEENPLVGTYVLSSATLAANTPEEVIIPPQTEDGNILPQGTDVVQLVGGILGAASPCSNQANTAIELASNGDMLYTCMNEDVDAEKTGTWSENPSNNTLTLNISSETIGNVSVNVSDYSISDTQLTGNIANFPFAKDFNYELGANLGTAENPNPNIQFVSVDVVFTVVQQ